ncbi:hypothetical protein GCM10023231_39730 [Olivibacter ginsenosidimutans]|uniref:DUF5689 domain-containing protein n=1 Tax=Olivibacter ginsenosidimutans TaxID=1176537 RepID=A0ABP9C8X5_9SPHI
MKNRYFAILLFSLIAVITYSCKEHDFAAGRPSPYISIADVRSIYKSADVQLTEKNLLGAENIVGLVISDPSHGNAPKNTIVVQQVQTGVISGISILTDKSENFASGDSVVVNIRGAQLSRVKGHLYLQNIPSTNINVVSSGNPLLTQIITASKAYASPSKYESTLVTINGGEITPKPIEGDILEGNRSMINGIDTLTIHTESTASFAQSPLPRNVNISGILFTDTENQPKNSLQIWPREDENIVDISDPEIPDNIGKFPIIISGFANDIKGADGNYEYIQLRAATDIDFSTVPFSVVVCVNANAATPNAGAAPGAGWATGGGRTYKFNLTSGKVGKGEFFYVGGSQKKINGANSTDIRDANWIRAIDYKSNAGDGLGDATSGLLPNSGNACGIALFVGTNISKESIPLDVVFMGGNGKTTIIDSVNNIGYRVPNNDHYHSTDPVSGNAQPFFYQGSNTYIFPYLTPADVGAFVKLGGKFNISTRTWTEARTYEHYELTKTSKLSELETGAGVTELEE